MSGFTVKRDSGLFIGDVDNSPASGTIDITENGTDIDVARYAKANVNVNTTDIGYMMMTKRVPIDEQGNTFSILPTNKYRIDDNVDTIGSYAFAGMWGCETIDLSNLNELAAVGDYAFFAGIQSGGAYLTSVLQSVIFPQNIRNYARIGLRAFEGCTRLTTLDLRRFFTFGGHCFANSGITTLYFSANISFGEDTFVDANNLTDIYYEGTQTQWETDTNLPRSGLSSSVTIHYDYVPSN